MLGLVVLAGLAGAFGLAKYKRYRTTVRIAAASGGIVQAVDDRRDGGSKQPVQDGSELLQSAKVEDRSLGLMARLPPFAPVAIRLLRLLDKDDVDARDIADQVASDPALRAQLLGVANSWLYAVSEPIHDPMKAITQIGIDQTRALAVTWAVRSLHAGAPKSGRVRRLWRHSLSTGIVAEQLADLYCVKPTAANTAGTLHDVGRIGLLSAHSPGYEQFLLQSWETAEEMLTEERAQFELNHCEAGCILILHWGLPEDLLRAARGHHQANSGNAEDALIHFSCQLANSVGFPAVTYGKILTPEETTRQHAPEEMRDRIIERLPKIMERLDDAVQRLDF